MRAFLLWSLLVAMASAATVRVQIAGRIVDLDLEEYVAATLAGESSVSQSEEALKAMAVAARTYAVHFKSRHAAEGFDLCDLTHCQRVDRKAVTARLTAIAKQTAGELLWYQGKPAVTYYTRDCGGRSEDVRRLARGERAVSDEPCRSVLSSRWRLALALGGQLEADICLLGQLGPASAARH